MTTSHGGDLETEAGLGGPARDRRRDLRGWLLTPAVTIVLAPALAASIGVLVAESATSYPRVCAGVAARNGCSETIFELFAAHARWFLGGWLLLWALPWWRSLRRARIWCAAAVGLVLVAAPLRLVTGDLFSVGSWQQVVVGDTTNPGDVDRSGVTLTVLGLLLVGVPAAGYLLFHLAGRVAARRVCAVVAVLLVLPSLMMLREGARLDDSARRMREIRDPDPPCVVHSGSVNRCPGG